MTLPINGGQQHGGAKRLQPLSRRNFRADERHFNNVGSPRYQGRRPNDFSHRFYSRPLTAIAGDAAMPLSDGRWDTVWPVEGSIKTQAFLNQRGGLVVRPPGALLRVVNQLTRFLPTSHRDRYGEEFRSELFELAATGASRWRQLFYLACQFNMVFELRGELRRGPSR